MSPTVRDGRRQRTEYAVELAAVGTGPIERRQADAHERAGFAPGRPTPGLPTAVPRRVPIADHETPVAALIHLADPPVTTVTPEEPDMAIEPPLDIPVESRSHLEQDPPPPTDARLDALRAVVAAVDELVAATEAYQAAGARLAVAEQAVEEAWSRAPWRPKGWTNIPETIPQPPARSRVLIDEPALEEELQSSREDAAVAAALRDDRLGDELADDAPEFVTRRRPEPDPTAQPAAAFAAFSRDKAQASAGGGPGLSASQERMLAAVRTAGGNLRDAAAALGVPGQAVQTSLRHIGEKGGIPIDFDCAAPGRLREVPAGRDLTWA